MQKVSTVSNRSQLSPLNEDGQEGSSEARGPRDGLEAESSLQARLSALSSCTSAGTPLLEDQAASQGGKQENQQRWLWGLGSSGGTVPGLWRALTLRLASPGEKTNCASRMAGCATWRPRSSASCPPTRRRTSSPSPSTPTSSRSGRWAPPAAGPRAPVCGGRGGWIWVHVGDLGGVGRRMTLTQTCLAPDWLYGRT